jgi:NodT family efflux transporter outer membrane factor (OMF) lipoprotein
VDEAKAVALDGQEMVIELHSAIIKLYLELTATYQLKDLSEEELKDTQEQIAIETQRQQVGMGSTAKVNDNEASLPIINNTISALNLRIQLLKTTLAALIGQGPGALDSLKRTTLTLHTNLELPSSLPLHLIANRPDVSAALSRLHEMQKKIQVAQAAFYPDVNLSAFIGFEAIGFSQLLSRQGVMAGGGTALFLPPFDGGLRQGQLNLATTEFDLAVDQYNQRVLDALKEISNSLAQLNSMNLQQQELKKALYKRQQSLLFAKESYQAGLTSYQSVLSNNQNYLTVAKRMVEIDQARLTAYAELMRALGGGSQ